MIPIRLGIAVSSDSLAKLSARFESLPKSAPLRTAALLDWAMDRVDDVIDETGVEQIIAIAMQLYDTYIAPIDVPWVPNLAEPVVIDEPAKWLIAQVIRGFHQPIHKAP